MFVYEYTDEMPRNFTQRGLLLSKGDTLESDVKLDAPYLKEVKPKKANKEIETNTEGSGE